MIPTLLPLMPLVKPPPTPIRLFLLPEVFSVPETSSNAPEPFLSAEMMVLVIVALPPAMKRPPPEAVPFAPAR